MNQTNLINILTNLLNQFSKDSNIAVTLKNVLNEIAHLINAEAASFFIHKKEIDKLVCQACVGPVDITDLSIPSDQGIVGAVFKNKNSKLIEDVKKEAAHLNQVDKKTGFETKSLMTVPVIFDGQVYGCLQALNKKIDNGYFEKDDLDYFELLALNLGIVLKNIELTEKAVIDKLIEKDIADAKIAQSVLFPSYDKYDFISGGVQPYRELSGDFIDYFEVNGDIAFIQGDVSGKGVPATILMSRCMSLFRLFAKEKFQADEIAKKMNNEIYGQGTDDRFVTCIIGWMRGNKIELVNCGHNPVIHYIGNAFKQYGTTAPPLGIVNSEGFLPKNKIFEVSHEESVYISTDGITEAKINNEELDSKGLAQIAKKQQGQSAPQRYQQIKEYLKRDNVIVHDDATLLIILPKTE
jgi:sigma-B regulation protein RsbU (phosphoserine phosphatase)